MLEKSIYELHQMLVNKEVTPLELTKEAIKLAKANNENAFETICEKEALEFASTLTEVEEDNLLYGIPFVAKDNFSTKDILTTASSEILKDYVPVFDATVIKKLKDAKAVLIAKATLDELAMGGTGTTGHKGTTFNPYDPSHTYMIGGSSCGSANVVANEIVPFALGSDTGDSVRKPASYAGLVGMKPTWGRISRFGLFPFAPSLDHVGYFTRNVADSAVLLNVLAGRDLNDATSSIKPVVDYTKFNDVKVENLKLAVLKPIIDSVESPFVKNEFMKSVDNLRAKGIQVDVIDFDEQLLASIYPVYLVISCAEATSNNANLDGIKFGPRNLEAATYQDVMIDARTKGFCELIKRRFVIGSYSLFKDNQQELFVRAQKARHLIVDKINEVLDTYDGIYAPCVSNTKNPIAGSNADKLSPNYLIAENHLAIGNFGGLPSITLPIALEDGFPLGANITGRAFDELKLFKMAEVLESTTSLKDLSIGKVRK